ncbi:MAG: hypothetical protein WCT01_00855 [Candidatus Shapirobacteria bacterium]
MRKKTTTNPTSYLVLILLSIALVAALVLVNRNQDNRRSAAFAGTDMLLVSSATTKSVGDKFSIQIYVDTKAMGAEGEKAKVDYVKTYMCFGNKVTIEASETGDISEQVRVGDKFNMIMVSQLEEGAGAQAGKTCANIEIKSEKPKAQLGEGTVLVGVVEFTALASGNENIEIVKDMSKVTGFNPVEGSTDLYLEIGVVNGVEMTFSQGVTKWSKTEGCNTTTGKWFCEQSANGEFATEAECQNTQGCESEVGGYVRTGCNTQVGEYTCNLVASGADFATEAECVTADANCVKINKWGHGTTAASCNTATGAWTCIQVADGTFNTKEGCEADAGCEVAVAKYNRETCNTATGKYICSQSSGGQYLSVAECEAGGTSCVVETTAAPILNYRITYAGVKNNNECASNWPVVITVRKGDLVKTYNHTPTPDGLVAGNLRVYKGSLALTDFTGSSGLSVFIKGPRHLQVKYAKDKQDSFYNLPGGEISLTTVATTSQVYDFTAYPDMACDVVGKNSSGPDGVCNGLDYSVVKTAALARSSVPKDSNALVTDMDGDCQMSSADLSLLAQTLKERQDQQY